ncbi:MAG: hypothetical protein MJY46_00420 [Bacteroidales bacterium]|nr:hypothetical protein [Bacteroidales bacterium]
MYYVFVINGRPDKAFIEDEVKSQLKDVNIKYELYKTLSEGDATRFVKIYCDFHQEDEICFVACGGTGTFSEVVNGVIGYKNKRVALLAYGSGNNFILNYPDRNFRSVKDMINGEAVQSDVIKCNNDYAINVINLGFDSMAAFFGARYILEGKDKPYLRGTARSVIFNRFNHYKIIVDGEKMSRGTTMFCTIANASYYGQNYKCAPYAKIDDGHMDVEVNRSTTLLTFVLMYRHFKDGHHVENAFCRRRMKFKNARHVEISSKSLIFLCVDGELVASRHFDINLIDKAVTLQLPAKKEN